MDSKGFGFGNPGDVSQGQSNSPSGPSSASGVQQTTRGVGVVSGLSEQDSFHAESNQALGLDTKAGTENQVPQQPSTSMSTDRGTFTCY